MPQRKHTLKGAAGTVVAAQRLSRRPKSMDSSPSRKEKVSKERSGRSGKERTKRERRTGEFKVQRPKP